MTSAKTPDDAERKAAAAVIKLQGAANREQAMREHEAEKVAVAAKTARLRALRLARDAAEAQQPKMPQPKTQQPKTQQPKAQQLKTQPPKTQQPKTPRPKTERRASAKAAQA
jgi:hypothetical protein